MKKDTFLLVLVACVGWFLACHKEEKLPTVIRGRVTDKVTGLPVEAAYVYFGIMAPESSGCCRDFSTYTDANGEYTRSVPVGYGWQFVEVYKENYLPKIYPETGKNIQIGKENIIDLVLVPEDGYLKFHLVNDIPGGDSIYLAYFNKTVSEHYSPSGVAGKGASQLENVFPKQLIPDSMIEVLKAFPSNEYVKLYWDTKPYLLGGPFNFLDSVFILRNDTVTYTIHF